MLILDLRWLGFALLVAFMGALGAGAWLHRRLRRPAGLPGWAAIAPELDQAPFGLLSLEGCETCRYANPYARRLLGLPAGSRLPGAPWPAPLNEDRAAVRRAGAASGRYRSVALAEEAGREGRFIHWWLTPFGEADLVFLFDVTAQRRAEEAARRLVNDLSHELRTPLATILTHLEVLGLPNISDETGRQSTALLKAEARRMARLVHQMLELGRLETAGEIERRPLDLLAIARGTVAQVAPQAAERGIALSLEADTPLPPCAGDEDRLHQVLLNLLDNAIKYSRPGDRVVVSLAPEAEGSAAPWLDYMEQLVAALDEAARAKAAAGIPLAAPDGFALQAPGRPEAPEMGGRSGADEPRTDLRRAAWQGAQAGFRVYQDWLSIINRYPTTRGLAAYITSTNTYAPDDGAPPAQNYPPGWLTAALAEVDAEPQVLALCWFMDGPLGDRQWDGFSLARRVGHVAEAADEFDALLR